MRTHPHKRHEDAGFESKYFQNFFFAQGSGQVNLRSCLPACAMFNSFTGARRRCLASRTSVNPALHSWRSPWFLISGALCRLCAQAGSIVQKWVLYMLRPPVNVSLSPRSRDDFRYEYYKTTLQSGRSLVRVGVIASGKGGGSDPIRCKQPISKHLLHLRITRSDVWTFYVSNCLVSARASKKQAFLV